MINLIVKIKKNLLNYYDNNLAFKKFGDLYFNLERKIKFLSLIDTPVFPYKNF